MAEVARLVLALLFISAAAGAAAADDAGHRACTALIDRVSSYPGEGPIFLRSYDGPDGIGLDPEPALQAAFTYDNALAVVALRACGETALARRIGDALLKALQSDRSGVRGRLRNAYRAGAVETTPVPPMGWWDQKAGQWDEDPYQVGTATGNVAWAALALLTLFDATQDNRYLDGAADLGRWMRANASDAHAPAGFNGGIFGNDTTPARLTWKSTEHNTDLAAVYAWLARLQPAAGWQGPARLARAFVAAQWDAKDGRFFVGTLPDGATTNRKNAGLDAELWPLLLANAPEDWRRSIRFVEQHHKVGAGFDFNDDRDGIWWEGTAQAALVYRAVGRVKDADRLLAAIGRDFAPGGLIWATNVKRLTTGLALTPTSTKDDFFYFRLPHLGATAWVALAGLGWNPLTGQSVTGKAP